MKKLVAMTLACLGLTFSSGAQAEEKSVFFPLVAECQSFERVIKYLKDNFDEVPVASGNVVVQSAKDAEVYNARQYIFANPTTYSFSTVLYFEDDNKACVVSLGEGFGPVIQDGI